MHYTRLLLVASFSLSCLATPFPSGCVAVFMVDFLGETNIVGTGTNNTVVMLYQTCKSFFWNAGTVPIQYCRPIWAEKLDEMKTICHISGNSYGAQCVSPDNNWFIQYVRSSPNLFQAN
ncbi:hypothetical protein BDZ97DRAFT_1760125 [Flammula alnicola]|nr:hypothetical protein BDZ97DRAFT_1760125 [Flammula alnicola]